MLIYIHDSFINLEILCKTESSYLFYQSFRDYNWNAFGSESLKGKNVCTNVHLNIFKGQEKIMSHDPGFKFHE